MNTTTTTKSTTKGKSSEMFAMLVICLLAIYGAFSLLQTKDTDSKWSQASETEESVVYRSLESSSGIKVLEN